MECLLLLLLLLLLLTPRAWGRWPEPCCAALHLLARKQVARATGERPSAAEAQEAP